MMQIKDPEAPATAAQISYLESLVSQRDNKQIAERYRLMKTLGAVQKGQASEWIDTLLTAPKKPVAAKVSTDGGETWVNASVSIPVLETKLEMKPQLTELPAFGYYMIDGALYYWDCTGKDAYPVLRKLQVITSYNGAKKGSWKKVYATYSAPRVTATFKPYGGKGYYLGEVTNKVRVPLVLAEAVLGSSVKPLTQDEAGKLGKQFGFCVRCGATLTDPVSVANGIGPVCAKYWF